MDCKMIQLKDGVLVAGNRYTNEMFRALETAYDELGLDVTVTAGRDGKHGEHSYHYRDRALDVRFWGVIDKPRLAQRLKELLPPFYDVVVEKDHYHLEADATKEKA